MIYLFVDSSGFGGIESHILQFALLVKRQNRDIEVLFVDHYPGHPLYQRLCANKIKYRFLSDIAPASFFSLLLPSDVVHAHGYKASLLSRFYRLRYSFRAISSFHAGEKLSGKLASYEYLNRVTSFLSYNFAVSSKIKRTIPFRCHLLNNFIMQLPEFKMRSKHKVLQVGFVGRLSHEKGIDRFIELSDVLNSCQFHVFGDGDEQSRLINKKNIQWYGAVDTMDEYWSLIDVLVISSRAEGLPMAALEAMAHGVPVIATNVGDLSKLVASDWIVEESDWKNLSILIGKLSAYDNIEWRALSKDSHAKIVDDFSGESRWEQIEKAYQL